MDMQSLKAKCAKDGYEKLTALGNPAVLDFVAEYVGLCQPDSVYVCDDSPRDREYIKEQSLAGGEEQWLALSGHSAHFDGYNDQARDKANTRYLCSSRVKLGLGANALERDKGLAEMRGYLKGIMSGRRMYVLFFCLGPKGSDFSLSCAQITDSAYVAHSEYILYRPGYEQLKGQGKQGKFLRYVHSAGELEGGVSKNIDKRRVYIDIDGDIVYSVNTQYAGNTVGLKKLSLRLAIKKAAEEGWLAEHMLIMGVRSPSGRISYFTGAFPSACGKTSTAMLPGETIVGDDIAYLRKREGRVYAVNVEQGVFGIIRDVNPKDNPLVWDVLTSPNEVIFSNVLITEGRPYWLGDGRDIPEKGVNYSGKWHKGKTDEKGKEITHSHKNARYTVGLSAFKNADSRINDPGGVAINGVIYGGRDSDTSPPLQQSFDWQHGVITMAASLESETTAATLGREGVRQFNPMSNLDFLYIPLGRYIDNYLKFVEGIALPPPIFSVNYFIRGKDGQYLTAMEDKRVWLKWAGLRVEGEAGAIETPTGYIPEYEDLRRLFRDVLDKDYDKQDYDQQFVLRVEENLRKIKRIGDIYKTQVADAPEVLFEALDKQAARLKDVKAKYGDYVLPGKFI